MGKKQLNNYHFTITLDLYCLSFKTFFPHKLAATKTVGDDKTEIQRDIRYQQKPNIRILIQNWTWMVDSFEGKEIL